MNLRVLTPSPASGGGLGRGRWHSNQLIESPAPSPTAGSAPSLRSPRSRARGKTAARLRFTGYCTTPINASAAAVLDEVTAAAIAMPLLIDACGVL